MRRLIALATVIITLALTAGARAEESPPDPRSGAVPLEAAEGWRARLALDRGEVGIWVVKAFPVLGSVGSDEVIALDDAGTLHVLIPYSGRWIPLSCLHDGGWLNGLAHGDADPTVPGSELYTGGRKGNLWEVVTHPHGAVEGRLVAHLPGEEIQTIVAGELDPGTPGAEVLVWCWPGGVHVARRGSGGWTVVSLGPTTERIRDAVVLPAAAGQVPEIATVSRGGRLQIHSLADGKLQTKTIAAWPNGLGRIALRRPDLGKRVVLYAVGDDGMVQRAERADDGTSWNVEAIFAGPAGMRGVASGRFDADPDVEAVALFGYGRKVQILRRGKEGWKAETIFEDRAKGHWLTVGEVDGRNATDEIFISGYGGRVVALHRPPGYGRPGLAAEEEEVGDASEARETLRVGWGAIRRTGPTLTPYVYFGGFLTKSLVYETLVRMDDAGRPVPGLATAWERLDDGRRWVFTLRDGARFHDATPCDADAVVAHLRRFVGGEEHAWLGMSSRTTGIRALDSQRIEITLSEPYPVPLDLAAINPCAVATAAALPDATDFAPVGTGPWRVVASDPLTHTLFAPASGEGRMLDVRFLDGGDHVDSSHIRALELGEVDVVMDSWVPRLPRDEVRRLVDGGEFELLRTRGSRVVHLAFNMARGPFTDLENRRRVATAVDRAALVADVEFGFATPTATLFATGLGGWPTGRVTAEVAATTDAPIRARVLVYEFDPDRVRLARALARQLRPAGIDLDVVVVGRKDYAERRRTGDYDALIDGTHGLPYDPHAWLLSHVARLPGIEAPLRRAVAAATDSARRAAYREIEGLVEREVPVVSLYAPDRLGLVRRGVRGVRLGRDGYRLEIDP